jgi:hypothetical protein
MNVDDLAALLHGRRIGPDRWMVRCPTAQHQHGDRHASLSLRRIPDGRHLLYCFSYSCEPHEIASALGIPLAELLHDSPRGQRRQATPRRNLPIGETRATALREAPAQPWMQPGVLALYVGADRMRAQQQLIDRARRAATAAGPSKRAWNILALAARLEPSVVQTEPLLDELAALISRRTEQV